jgi:hypothetical protein
MNVCHELEYLLMVSLSSQIYCFQERLKPNRVEHLSGTSF